MKETEERSRPALRRLPTSARKAAAEKAATRVVHPARAQFARTFADVLSGRFGGRWSVEWQGTGRPSTAEHGNGSPLADEE